LAERVLGKDEVTSSILVIGSILRSGMQTEDPHRRLGEGGLLVTVSTRATDGKPEQVFVSVSE
jgi:hypothetical protein